jgi:hypothetical protein
MTTEPNEPTPAPVDDVDEHDDVDEPQTIEQARKLRAENRSLRNRLRALEEEYGAASAVLSAMQLAEVKRVAAEVLHDPDDLLAHQPDMAQYFDDEFTSMISADKVTERAKELIAGKPHLAKPPTAPPPTDRPIESLRPGARGQGAGTDVGHSATRHLDWS